MGTAEHKASSRCSSSAATALAREQAVWLRHRLWDGAVSLDWRVKIAAIYTHHTTGIKGLCGMVSNLSLIQEPEMNVVML